MTEKVLFSYVSKEGEDGIKIEISHDEDFFTWDEAQPHCGCMMFKDHLVDYTADLHAAPRFARYEESNPRNTLSWLKSMYEDLYGDGDSD